MIQQILPRQCVYEFTLACNLRCEHCGSKAGQKKACELSTHESKLLVSELAKLGCQTLTFAGGEPFLRGDWEEIFSHAKEKGMKVAAVSNGTIINKRLALKIRKTEPAIIAVSLDGMEQAHDKQRGAGSFRKALIGIRNLLDQKIPINIVTQANKISLPDLDYLCDLIFMTPVLRGINSWMIQLTTPMGRAKTNNLVISGDQFRALVDFISLKKTWGIPVYPADDIGYFHTDLNGKFSSWKGCQAGLSVIGIEADGNVRGCLSMQAMPIEGNIRQNSLHEIWNSPDFASYNRKKKKLTGKCAACKFGDLCHAGCIGTAAAFGKISEYPFCTQNL
jgi:radical SAM protein with 4Fe4S-binding SPASM domain